MDVIRGFSSNELRNEEEEEIDERLNFQRSQIQPSKQTAMTKFQHYRNDSSNSLGPATRSSHELVPVQNPSSSTTLVSSNKRKAAESAELEHYLNQPNFNNAMQQSVMEQLDFRKKAKMFVDLKKYELALIEKALSPDDNRVNNDFSFDAQNRLYFSHFNFFQQAEIEHNYHWIVSVINNPANVDFKATDHWKLNQLKLLCMSISFSIDSIKPKDFIVESGNKMYHEHTNGRSKNNPSRTVTSTANEKEKGSKDIRDLKVFGKMIKVWEDFLEYPLTKEDLVQIKDRHKYHDVFLVDKYPEEDKIMKSSNSLIENLYLYHYYNHTNYYYYCVCGKKMDGVQSHFQSARVCEFDKFYLHKLQDVIKLRMCDPQYNIYKKQELAKEIIDHDIFLGRPYQEMQLIDYESFKTRVDTNSTFNKCINNKAFDSKKNQESHVLNDRQEELLRSFGCVLDHEWDRLIDALLHNGYDISYMHQKKSSMKNKFLSAKFLREMLWVIAIVKKSEESNLIACKEPKTVIDLTFGDLTIKIQNAPRESVFNIFTNLLTLIDNPKYESLNERLEMIRSKNKPDEGKTVSLVISQLISLIGCNPNDNRSQNKKK